METVKQVLADHKLAPQLLPTESGFFFGSQEYDNWYIQDLEETKNILETVLNDRSLDNWDFYYQSSW